MKKKFFWFCVMAVSIMGVISAGPSICLAGAADFDSVEIADSDGNVSSDVYSGKAIFINAVFDMKRAGIVILHGTVEGENWSATLRPVISFVRKGENKIQWQENIPAGVQGAAVARFVLYLPLLQRSIRSAFFTVLTFEADYIGSDVCSMCHQDVFDTWSTTRHAPGIGCEMCHGPGSEHASTGIKDYIITDISSEVCGRCHRRNDGNIIEAEDGFIKSQQQYNEWKDTRHAETLGCVTCHDPHYSLDLDRGEAIRSSCADCHHNQKIYLNMSSLACEDCHMSFAVSKVDSEGEGLYRKGDVRTHVWRIKGNSEPEDMFNFKGTEVVKDSGGPYVTLNFSCLSCHNGRDAIFEDLQSVRQTFPLVH